MKANVLHVYFIGFKGIVIDEISTSFLPAYYTTGESLISFMSQLGIFLRFLPTMLVNITHSISTLKDRRHRPCAQRQEQPMDVCSEYPLHAIRSYQASATTYLIITSDRRLVSHLFSLIQCSWILYWKVFHTHPTTRSHFRPLNIFSLSEQQKVDHNSGLLVHKFKFNIQLSQTANLLFQKALLFAVRDVTWEILLKNKSCHLMQKATPHVPSRKTAPPDGVRTDIYVFIQPTFFTCVLPLHCFSLHRRLSLILSNHRPFLSFQGSLCPIKHICSAFAGKVSWAEGPEWYTLH